MGFLETLTGLVNPVTKLIDDLHTSDEEKLQLKGELKRMELQLYSQVLNYEEKIASYRRDVIVSEAKSESWLTSSWRPIVMLSLMGLIFANQFGWLAVPLPPDAWTLIQIGLGGYAIGRSVEKVVPALPQVMEKMAKNKENK